MKSKYVFSMIVLSSIFLIFTFQEPWQIIRYENRGEYERWIVFLQDAEQKKFILKCYDDTQKEEAICEDLASLIGRSIGVPIHAVQMIQKEPLLVDINNGASLATLHTCVPGREVCRWFEDAAGGIILKGGLVSERHLYSLVASDDLCDIVTLDIFLNNRDRHYGNCFFDEVTMRYYGIDMGDCFLDIQMFPNVEQEFSVQEHELIPSCMSEQKIVAFNSYVFLCGIRSKNFLPAQIRTLQRIQSKLYQLLALYPADVIFDLWMLKAQTINYTYTEYKKNYLKISLACNMYWVEQVIKVINEIVA